MTAGCPARQLEAALVEGLKASGMEVAAHRPRPDADAVLRLDQLKTDGAVMVTGSHNPPDYNGFKMMLGGKPFFGDADQRRWASMAAAGDVVAETRGAGTARRCRSRLRRAPAQPTGTAATAC